MTYYDSTSDITRSPEYQAELVAQKTFMARVYAWMTIGLLITALAGLVVAGSKDLQKAFLNSGTLIVMLLVQVAIAFGFGLVQRKLPAVVSAVLFLLYSAITGVTLGALVLLVYQPSAIVSAFCVTAGMFGTMSVYGYVTKRDLTSWGTFLFMGLIGIILASIVSMFFGGPSPMMHFVICIVGVIVFTGLTAYDTQKIKQSYAVGAAGSDLHSKAAVNGAFDLYLDFINLFIYILQLFGRSRD